MMLERLIELEELSLVRFPMENMWRQVHVIGGHKKLRKLAIYYSEPEVEDIEALVRACNEDFPSLVDLDLHLVNMSGCSSTQLAKALAGLESHNTLCNINCGWDSEKDKGHFFPECRQILGPGIQVNEITFIENE